jgi:chorismate synthase
MKNIFGTSLQITLFGESHGEEIGVVLDGLAPGITIDDENIRKKLSKRRPSGTISTKRVEPDNYRIVSGVFNGKTTGTPLCILIPNTNTKSVDYEKTAYIPRPSHADYTAFCKYHGFQDYRGGGHFSGRITAPIVAAGAILETALNEKNIHIGTHISFLGGMNDRKISSVDDIIYLKNSPYPTLDSITWENMQMKISQLAEEGDSIGGILETAIYGIPAGVGEPWFDGIEGVLSKALFAVPAVKGVEFGLGFGFANGFGSELNDPIYSADNAIFTSSNNNGGINGGITNGMPVTFRCAIKPTPSIFKKQDSVDLQTMKNTTLLINGRHDPAIIHRVAPVIDAVTSLTVYDILSTRFGTDYFLVKEAK